MNGQNREINILLQSFFYICMITVEVEILDAIIKNSEKKVDVSIDEIAFFHDRFCLNRGFSSHSAFLFLFLLYSTVCHVVALAS